MDKQALIEKYKNQEEQVLYRLADDRLVIGQEVDGDNSLWYVIRKDTEYSVESAWNQPIVETMSKPLSRSSHIDLGTPTE